MPDDPPLTLRIGPDELVVRDRYESASIVNDILIGVWFVVGSALFFGSATETAGTVLFLVGSVQMLLRPGIRLARRVHLRRIGSVHAETARDF
ncbi:YrhK-like protein [Isoptericola jiangsuensis]|uniref:YrhK-like protein n=1 Tax=Isoptericola jiangsuensis TaxID=548579 RepID=A0A2A9F2W4_9MICO|nr:YrhK family protein [Isoptericola jiangsuensis]PFG44850.1 YrhK-like protein [Isoptericola jiangsuensis]